jgi:hypothetical protein
VVVGLRTAVNGILHARAVALAAGTLALAGTAAGATAAGASAPLPPLVDAACDGRLVLRQGGTVSSGELEEVSGVVESRRRAGVLWVHNDSGDTPRLFAIGLDGRTLGVFELDGVAAVDWEDIAAGPGPVQGRRYLYVADIGDNDRQRATVSVVRLAEPLVDPESPSAEPVLVRGADELVLRYPDGPHNAEALLVDPRSGELVVVTKELSGTAEVFRAPAGLIAGSDTMLRRVGSINLGLGSLVTGGDVSPSGNMVALRTYGAVFLYARPKGKPLWAAFRARRCRGIAPPEAQGEAIALRTSGRAYVTIAEGEHPTVHRVQIRSARASVARAATRARSL